jgi:hypothetical protein
MASLTAIIVLLMFQIVRVPENAPESTESLGTKEKFWYNNHQYLFKKARANTGEDWAEKIAAEVAGVLGLPHADYEMADWDLPSGSERGIISRNFCDPGEALILGNELLSEADPNYAVGSVSKFRVPTHTVERVIGTLRERAPALPKEWSTPHPADDAVDVFVGYLLLDALIGNTDRHHENWGVVRAIDGRVRLAPTFDHASSLGRNLLDSERAGRLSTRDRNADVNAFGVRARCALYNNETDKHPLLTWQAFAAAMRYCTTGALRWLQVLDSVGDAEIATIIDNVPHERISDTAAEFAKQLMRQNKARILALVEDRQ